MTDHEALRTALTGLRDAALAHIDPPGVDAVRRTVRRRQSRRTAAAVAIAALLLVAAAFAVPVLSEPVPAPVQPPPTQPTTLSSDLTPSPVPSSTTTTSPSTGGAAGDGSGACVPKGHAKMTALEWSDNPRGMMSWIEVETTGYHRLCPGETVRAFWATYRLLPDNSQVLYKSGEFLLSHSNTKVTTYIDAPVDCRGIEVFVTGDYPIQQTIPAGVLNPYPGYSEQARGGTLSWSNVGSCSTSSPGP